MVRFSELSKFEEKKTFLFYFGIQQHDVEWTWTLLDFYSIFIINQIRIRSYSITGYVELARNNVTT